MSANDFLVNTDIPDPSDFPPSDVAPGLRDLDEALRCSICRELYDAPVTISCGHCYCSCCIRSVLQVKGECPICRQTASDTHIRKNPAMESAVKAWNLAARAYVLELCKEEEQRSLRQLLAPPVLICDNSPQANKKRKRAQSEADDDEVQIVSGPSKPASSGFKPKRKASKSSPRSPATPPSSRGLVTCPVCNRDVPLNSINTHLDSNCQRAEGASSGTEAGDKGKQKQKWSKILGGNGNGTKGGNTRKGKEKERAESEIAEDTEYLPKVSYTVLKDSIIKERLLEHDLLTTGDRSALIRRHTKWVMIFNANLDRSATERKTLSQLRRDLQTWEDERKTKKQTVTDTAAYEKANKNEFANLIAAARPKKAPDRDHTVDEDPPRSTATVSEKAVDWDVDDTTA